MPPQMSDLVEFLRARLDEDEAAARASTPGPWWHDPAKEWRDPARPLTGGQEAVFAGERGAGATTIATTGPSDDRQSMDDARHIARHDPARVLREVAAKRAIVEAHSRAPEGYLQQRDGNVCRSCKSARIIGGRREELPIPVPCATLRHLAAVYADHEDYHEEWKP